MSGAAAVTDTTDIPPLGRDRRVHAWILSGAISEAGDVAWYGTCATLRPPIGNLPNDWGGVNREVLATGRIDGGGRGSGGGYIQVGVGSGNVEETFVGDHDVWRLPEVDDHLTDPSERFLRNRPVFRAAAPGKPISPNLAGRTAAAFALAAQVETNPATARRHLTTAAQIYAQAQIKNVGQLVTSLPFAFYPETAWRDDLELGATELALAANGSAIAARGRG